MANLININFYKQAKGLTSPKDDERLSTIIESVSHLIKTYCNNTFNDYVTEEFEQSFNVDASQRKLILEQYPIISINEVLERTSMDSEYIAVEAYETDNRDDSLIRTDRYWAPGFNSVKVKYNAGYLELPMELNLAAVDMVTYYYKDEYKKVRSISSSSMSNSTTSTIANNIGFPDHIKRVLDMYRQL